MKPQASRASVLVATGRRLLTEPLLNSIHVISWGWDLRAKFRHAVQCFSVLSRMETASLGSGKSNSTGGQLCRSQRSRSESRVGLASRTEPTLCDSTRSNEAGMSPVSTRAKIMTSAHRSALQARLAMSHTQGVVQQPPRSQSRTSHCYLHRI